MSTNRSNGRSSLYSFTDGRRAALLDAPAVILLVPAPL